MIETAPMTQKERMLALLNRRMSWTNYELRAMDPPMFQYPVRIFELREDGHRIVTERDENDRRKVTYTHANCPLCPFTRKEDLFS